jgi:hypothetical protein
MAMRDYRLCDVCGNKAFYDAHLNYEQERDTPKDEMARDCGYKLDYLGDWAVICIDCAKTHKTVVVPLTAPSSPDPS